MKSTYLTTTPVADTKSSMSNEYKAFQETIVEKFSAESKIQSLPFAISDQGLMNQFLAEKKYSLKKQGKSVSAIFKETIIDELGAYNYFKQHVDVPFYVSEKSLASKYMSYRASHLVEWVQACDSKGQPQGKKILMPRQEFFIAAKKYILRIDTEDCKRPNRYTTIIPEPKTLDQSFFILKAVSFLLRKHRLLIKNSQMRFGTHRYDINTCEFFPGESAQLLQCDFIFRAKNLTTPTVLDEKVKNYDLNLPINMTAAVTTAAEANTTATTSSSASITTLISLVTPSAPSLSIQNQQPPAQTPIQVKPEIQANTTAHTAFTHDVIDAASSNDPHPGAQFAKQAMMAFTK